MNPGEARARLGAARVATLVSTRPDGRPHAVPFVFALHGSTLYSAVDHKPKSSQRLQRIRNIEATPNVTVLVHEYEDDWSQLWWVRSDGVGRVIETGDEWESAVEALAAKYPQYRGQPPTGAVIAIDIESISGWAASD